MVSIVGVVIVACTVEKTKERLLISSCVEDLNRG